ncbi:hypothetical protein SNE40_011749 [Patella caerulea]|uniref:DNA-directed RNA polymerase III subunit RPC3 n=1 Tax=Patella caerulea TaxID=87958 RepID=A0AAN8PPQ3_PATCE
MSKCKVELAYQILKELHGEVVAEIARHLMKFGPRHIKLISEVTQLRVNQIKKGICILIQHNFVKFDRNKKGVTEYAINTDAVSLQLRYPRYIYCAKTLYGDAAELLVEELLQNGQSLMSIASERVTQRLNEALEATGNPKITSSLVRDKFGLLVKTHFLRRCQTVLTDDENRVISSEEPKETESLFILPPLEAGSKRKRNPDGSGPPSKRSKMEEMDIPPDDGVYWMINVERFHQYFRDQLIINCVNSKIDKQAGEIIRNMLRLSEIKTEPHSTVSATMTITEIFHSLPKELGMTKHIVEQYLSILTEDSVDVISKVCDSSGGLYVINIFKVLKSLCQAHIESFVQERFGSKCLRIFRVLILKKHLEQKQIEEYAMIPTKEAKELLYNMFAEHFITLTEISKTVDHAPSRTYYVFRVNIDQVARIILEKCYKAAGNAIIRRQMEVAKHKRVLDKQERVDAIIASLDQAGADEAQKEEIKETITPPEKEQLERCRTTVNMLEQSEIQTDETIFIIETYLYYSLLNTPIK